MNLNLARRHYPLVRKWIENHEDDDTENPDYPLNEPWFEEAIEENGNTVEDIVSDDEFWFTDN